MNQVDRFADFVLKFRKSIVFGFILLVAVFSIFLKDISIDGSSRIWFEKDSKILKDYDKYLASYGSEEGILISFKNPTGVFNKADLQVISQISAKVEALPYFDKVFSLLNYPYIHLDKEYPDDVIVDDFISDIESLSPDDLLALKAIAKEDEGLVGNLLSKDATTTSIGAKLLPKYTFDTDISVKITQEIHAILSEYEKKGYIFYLSGAPFINDAFLQIATSDGVLFTALSIVTVFLLLLFMFRSFLGSFLALMVVVMTIVIVLSIQTLIGYQLNSFTANIPVFVVAIGIVHAIHIYWVWAAYCADGHDSKEAVRFAIHKNLMPVFLTSLTTAIGFASLGISEVVPIKTLGFATASAAMVAFVLSVMFVPAVLSFFHHHKGEKAGIHFINPQKYAAYIVRNDKKIVGVSLILFIFFAVGVSKIEVDNNVLTYFKSDHPIRTSMDFVSENISAPLPFELIVDSKQSDGVKSPTFLKLVQKFQDEYVKTFSEVKNAQSMLSVIKQSHLMFNAGDKAFFKIPNSQEVIAQYLLLYSLSLPITDRIDPTFRYFRISVATDSTTTSKQLEMIQWAEDWWKHEGLSVAIEGQPAMFAYMQPKITQTLIYSIGTAILLISVVMLIVFRSFKLLGYFLIPNLFPILAALGVMGWLAIYVDMGVAISAAIVLGIAVDDAIHFLLKYLDHLKKGHTVQESLEHVMKYTGGAIVLTTLILSAAFIELAGSSFMPNVYFALTTVSALLIAVIADILLLPALFSLKDSKRNKEQ